MQSSKIIYTTLLAINELIFNRLKNVVQQQTKAKAVQSLVIEIISKVELLIRNQIKRKKIVLQIKIQIKQAEQEGPYSKSMLG